jgi:hypothetical protein
LIRADRGAYWSGTVSVWANVSPPPQCDLLDQRGTHHRQPGCARSLRHHDVRHPPRGLHGHRDRQGSCLECDPPDHRSHQGHPLRGADASADAGTLCDGSRPPGVRCSSGRMRPDRGLRAMPERRPLHGGGLLLSPGDGLQRDRQLLPGRGPDVPRRGGAVRRRRERMHDAGAMPADQESRMPR